MNKPFKHSILIIFLLLVVFKAWAQDYNYAPNTIAFCQLQKRYDATLSGGISQGNNFTSKELQATFSPVKHGAIMINYFDAKQAQVRRQEKEGVSSHLAEIAIGAYENTGRGTNSIFIGFGQGSIFNNYPYNHATSFDLQRWFIQPTILRYIKNFEWGFALRFNRLIYTRGDVDYNIGDYELRAIKELENKAPLFVPEFGLHGGLNFSFFTASVNLTNLFYSANNFNFERVNTNLMLTFNMGKISKQKKSKLHSKK